MSKQTYYQWLFRTATVWSWVVSLAYFIGDSVDEPLLRRQLPAVQPRVMLDMAVLPTFLFGDREPLVRLLTADAGQRRWNEQYLFGCNPLLDLLWSDERFHAAMRKLTVERCRLARPWPIPPRPQQK